MVLIVLYPGSARANATTTAVVHQRASAQPPDPVALPLVSDVAAPQTCADREG